MSSSSNHKPTRSRASSPVRPSSSSASQSHSRGGKTDGSRTFMQRWLEPAVQIKPSFQEAGLVRGGVVENMAPLGTMPKAAMLRKAPPCAENAPAATSNVTRIVLKKPFSTASGGAAAAPASTTLRAANLPDITRMSSSESAMVEDDDAAAVIGGGVPGVGAGVGVGAGAGAGAGANASLPPAFHPALRMPVADDIDDGDYVPKPSKARRVPQPIGLTTSSASTTPLHRRRQSHRHRSAQSSPALPPLLDPTPDPTTVPTSPAQSDAPPFHQLTRDPCDKDQADKIVEIAVEEALRHFRYPTAWALRLLYDENCGDPHFVSMIVDIYNQRATPKTVREFLRLVGEKKREGKRENKGCYYFVPPSTGSRLTPHKPEPAPYENLVKMDFATLLRNSFAEDSNVDNDGHIRKKRKTESAEERATSINQADPHTDQSAAGSCTASQGIKQEDQPPSLSHRPAAAAKNKVPKGKKTRSGSVTSTSSLSSVPDDAIEDYVSFMDSVDGDLGDQADENNAQIPAGSMQPISAEQAKPALKKQIVSPISSGSEQTTPTSKHSCSRDSSMPAAVVATTAASSNGASHQNANQPIPPLKFHSRFAGLDESAAAFIQKKLAQKAETAGNTKSVSVESFVREPLGLDELPEEPGLLPQLPPPPPEYARLSRTPAPVLSSRAARAAKRNHDELDGASSPVASSFRADFETSSARNSRAATPSNPRSSKKSRGGLRVKTSPMKKKGTSAGIPRGIGERPSPVGNNSQINNQDDNDDSCYTCGGNGELVCCDGCTYSFHFVCIDPPMDQGHIPDEWFCNECQIRYNPPLVNEHKGIFGPLTANLQRKNPRSFRLPENIRDYFEGVKTGAEGEYEEAAQPKPKTNKKSAEEPFDFFKVRNGDKAVLCHHCHKGVTDNRPIIPCSVCGLNWHLECLSPPLTLPPILRTWRCPCHVDDLLGNLPARLAPAHKYRKIKHLPVIEQNYSRGLANNGWIEIQDDSDADELAWKENKAFGRVFRVSAKGVKRDFVSRVYKDRGQSNLQSGTLANPTSTAAPEAQSLQEQQAALALLQLVRGQGEGIHQVVEAVMAQASPTAVSMMAQGNALRIGGGSLADADVVALETLLSQADSLKQTITTILERRAKHNCDKPNNELKALTPSSISHDDSTIVDDLKLELSSSQDSEKGQDVDDTKPLTNSAMQID